MSSQPKQVQADVSDDDQVTMDATEMLETYPNMRSSIDVSDEALEIAEELELAAQQNGIIIAVEAADVLVED